MKRTVFCGVAFTLLLAACHGTATHTNSAAAVSTPDATIGAALSDRYGFVSMDTLMRAHPLASQLQALNRQITTMHEQLEMSENGQDIESLHATQAGMQSQLQTAAARARALLQDEGHRLTLEEHAQVGVLLAQQGNHGAAGASAPSRTLDVNQAFAQQREAYSNAVEAEKQQAIKLLAASINSRDMRVYTAKQQALAQQETQDAITFAQANTTERVSLQTRAAAPGLSAAEKHAITESLNGLDAKEAAQRTTEHAANLQILSQLHDKLQADSQKQFNFEVARIRSSSEAELLSRGQITKAQVAASMPPAPVPTTVVPDVELQARIKAIHAHFQERFDADTRASVAAFRATRTQLQARFNQIEADHLKARSTLTEHIRLLEHERDALITKMSEQIRSKTISVAEHASIDVVMVNVLAQSHAIDLTHDVAHELTRIK